ncbi:MAG: 16S rRNA (cytosine(1402)-N(4))-methyltransferase RsmH [Deltaproteobacteria bacterium]|nr:16S rRNA (cytosine(1402)-N(4))-methyltransferase RsmH [Deltaproteobacteria bacterium]MBW2143323.1 16S rRNA (cytosine(1402)-N(4))-methyltransferase RsmH [Deltaproteobacteria bacterium]
MEYPHRPVLLHEVVKHLCHIPDGVYADCTVGSAGHSLAIGKSLAGKGHLICLDRDPGAVSLSKKRLDFLGNRVSVIKSNYTDLDKILRDLGVEALDGALLDLGMSSYQLENSGRGFSFNRDEPLDMRMDPDDETTAYRLVNNLSPQDLERILRDYGEEKKARLIARAIVRAREKKPIETSFQLAGVIKLTLPKSHRIRAKHPATRTFQALRIAVNGELQNIDSFLSKIPSLMAKGGRLVVLSYHSLEDRRVKQAMSHWEKDCTCPPDFPQCVCGKTPLFRRLFKKGIKPSPEEFEKNPRARSAVLRAAERI